MKTIDLGKFLAALDGEIQTGKSRIVDPEPKPDNSFEERGRVLDVLVEVHQRVEDVLSSHTSKNADEQQIRADFRKAILGGPYHPDSFSIVNSIITDVFGNAEQLLIEDIKDWHTHELSSAIRLCNCRVMTMNGKKFLRGVFCESSEHTELSEKDVDIVAKLRRQMKDSGFRRETVDILLELFEHDAFTLKHFLEVFLERRADFSLSEKLAIIVKSKVIADSMRSVFDICWKMAELYESGEKISAIKKK